ncbi:ribosome biogenesis GTP-binding protein YihA/YsxC [Dubosiella newyorkensis]|uniref:ribosome biogenesis GTP-binding protein YihA/YsxC n=1 Tax=Dubosiella newyorkensis TaxID=1862672 RepID=UPI00257454B0|nr:ribosome biogenesis GTP-binding protein YihA/YsxC [Dubosiella newyorkensis]
MNSEFLTSATKEGEYPEADRPEIVVVGRSNVGKSSFINAFTNRKKLAYVGNTPGKTQLINFFMIDGAWYLVDVPGYGYAKLSKAQIAKLGRMMDEYFLKRKNLTCVVQLVDARHDPSKDDMEMVDFFKEMHIPIVAVATKIDKIPKTKRINHLKKISQKLQIPLANIFAVSSTEKIGFEQVEEELQKRIEQAKKMDKQ